METISFYLKHNLMYTQENIVSLETEIQNELYSFTLLHTGTLM